MNTSKIDSMLLALRCGEISAELDIIPGNVFRGAFGAAADFGYTREKEPDGFSMFVSGYLSKLPAGGVTIDKDGRAV